MSSEPHSSNLKLEGDLFKMKNRKLILTSALIYITSILSGCKNEDYNIQSETLKYEVSESKFEDYNTSNIELYLPNTVTQLTRDYFSQNLLSVKSIYIGKDVQSISDDTFVDMPSLSSVYVDKENEFFVSSPDGKYLASMDGSTIFIFGTDKFDIAVFEYADSIGKEQFCKDGFNIIFGNSVLYFAEPTEESGSTGSCSLTKAEAYGYTVKLNTNFLGNHIVDICSADDFILITDYTYRAGDTYIIYSGGVWEQHNMDNLNDYNYNDKIVCYFLNQDGELCFKCFPRKYLFTGIAGDLLKYSTGYDEIYKIEGTADFIDGEPILTVENEVTLDENYTDEQLIKEFEIFLSSTGAEYESMDALFEHNEKLFNKFEF